MKTLREVTQQIWHERINQNLDAALSLFSEVKLSRGMTNLTNFADLELQRNSPESEYEICELLALESSIARAQRNPTLSAKAMQKIEAEVTYSISNSSFIYQFEKGISFFTESRWIEAVHHFLKAKKLSAGSLQKATCLINLILCSEYLDISFDTSLEEIQHLMADLNSNFKKGLDEQLHSLHLREKWRKNLITASDFKSITHENLNQSVYFIAYLAQLPRLKQHFSGLIDASTVANRSGHLFNKDFRIRTLTYTFSPQDQHDGRLIDHVERLYLWTLNWMENPNTHNTELLGKSLKAFPWEQLEKADTLSPDGRSMLILSLGRLNFYDNSFSGCFNWLRKRISFSSTNMYLFSELESLENELNLLKSETQQHDSSIAEAEAIIDMNKFQIRIQNKTVRSKSFCLSASLLLAQKEIDVDLFWMRVFNGKSYDHFLNAGQVSNLIYKLNRLFKNYFVINQKDGKLFTTVLTKQVEVVKYDVRVELLANSTEWQSFMQIYRAKIQFAENTRVMSKSKMLVKLREQSDRFNRRQMQAALMLSKSHANRLLNEWVNENIITKQGHGKKTVYLFCENNKRTAS